MVAAVVAGHMRFVRYDRDGSIDWGVLRDSTIHRLSAFPEGEPDLADVANPGYRSAVERAVETGPSRRSTGLVWTSSLRSHGPGRSSASG